MSKIMSPTLPSEIATKRNQLRLGFLLNPYAGVGGPAGLKGSDGAKAAVLTGELVRRAATRAREFLFVLEALLPRIKFLTVNGEMGAELLQDFASTSLEGNSLDIALLEHEVCYPCSPEDTQKVTKKLCEAGVDLLVFVGGDGTARDVCASVERSVPVLGVPSGVKMHSGVFGITPKAAAMVVRDIVDGSLVSLMTQEVRDIDEQSFRNGVVKSRHYGELLVPCATQYIQQVKQGGREVDELVLADIAADIEQRIEELAQDALIIFAPGSTTHFIQEDMGCVGTLLGVDVYQGGELICRDTDAASLEALLAEHKGDVRIVLTAIGGQGHVIGRGNQQLSPRVLRRVGRDRLWLVCSKRKLNGLESRPLLMDSGDSQLDQQWQGLIPVITGYQDQVLYRLGWA